MEISAGIRVARHNDKVVFVEDAMPGDQGDVQVTKRKRFGFDQAQFIRRDQTEQASPRHASTKRWRLSMDD